jgi:SAM-dependent methyltransferase
VSLLIGRLDRAFYPQQQRNWDDSLFREAILAALAPHHHVLDLGAGAGVVAQMNFRGRAARVCGVDPDPRVAANPHLDEGKVGTGERIPYPNESFDLVLADNVLEHLADPESVFREVHRVLKPGGLFLAKTPNKRHYMALIARSTPHRFHQFVNRLRGRASVDTFPTLYRVNTPGDARRYAALTGYAVESMQLIEGRPEYLRWWFPAYLIGIAYERIVNAVAAFAGLRILLMMRLRKS